METEQMSEPTPIPWPRSPFGDFLAYMAENNIADWVWPYMEICSRLGVCHSDPSAFILARPVDSSVPIDRLNALADIDPKTGLTPAPDAWHILYASGDIRNFFPLATYELPKLIWQRNGGERVRILNYQTVKDRIHGRIQTKSTKPA